MQDNNNNKNKKSVYTAVCGEQQQDLEEPLLFIDSSSREQTTNSTIYVGVILLGVFCAWAAFNIVLVLFVPLLHMIGVCIFGLTIGYAMVLFYDFLEQDDQQRIEQFE
jgi:hypothetical protein